MGKAKSDRNCSGRKSGRNPPNVGACAKLSFWQRCDSSASMIRKMLSVKFRKTVKLGNRKSLVIVVGENLTEIRPPSAIAQKWRFSFPKMGLVGSADLGNSFSESSVSA